MATKNPEKYEHLKEYNLKPLFSFGPVEGVTASVILDVRREKIQGVIYYPCKYRIGYAGKQVYYPCMDLTPDEFSRMHNTIRDPNLTKSRKLIEAGFNRIKKVIEEIMNKEPFSFDQLARRLSRGTEDSIFTAFDDRIAELDREGKIGSVVWYTSAKNSFKNFDDRNLTFAQITPEWLKRYERKLREGGKEFTTISINMRALRAIFNKAKAEGIISEAQYPFEVKRNGKYKIPEAQGTKRALTEDQLYKIFDYKLSKNEEIYRDLWIFSFYCNGANIGDILRFKNGDITGNVIEWYRAKTLSTDKEKRKIRAVVTQEMKDIIRKYGNRDKRPDAYLFPHLTAGLSPKEERMIIQNLIHCINKRMKKIGRALKYGDITTYWARHTWASISRRKAVSLFAISKGMGHKTLATTQAYLDTLPDDELMENANKLPRRKI